jgi:vacuole morphology and inheritance protein 14
LVSKFKIYNKQFIKIKEAQRYRSDLVPSVLACFSDPDSRVRYYGCESLYNIVKVLRANVLVYFNEIFDGLCKLCCDLDLNVRNGAELLGNFK